MTETTEAAGTIGRALIASTREKIGLRPVEMARAMGVSYSTFKKWASGVNQIPPVAERLLFFMRAHPKTAREAAGK